MSETLSLALIAATPPTLAALGALTVGLINSRKANKIHVLVNSSMTRVQSDLALAKQRIEELQSLVATLTHGKGAPL